MIITLAAPVPLNGDLLADELAAAGVPDPEVALVGDEVQIIAPDDDRHRATVQQVVRAHNPPAPGPSPDPDAEFRAAVEGATTLAALKAAILGSTGPGAQPRNGR